MTEQKINHITISCLEILDNSEQKKGGKYVSILCKSWGGDDFSETGQAVLYPSGLFLTVRTVEKSTSGEYVAVLKGIHRKELRRGNLIIPRSQAVYQGKDAFFLFPSSKERLEKGSFFVEGGIFTPFNSRNGKPSVSLTFHGRIASARFYYPFPLVPGARYFFSREDNRDLRFPATLVFPGTLNNKDSAVLSDRLLKFGGRPSLKAVYSIILRMNKSVNLPPYMHEEEFEGSVRIGSWAVMSREYERIRGALLKRAAAFGGIIEKDLASSVSGDRETVYQIISELVASALLERREGFLVNMERDAASSLSPIAAKLLADLESEEEGLRLAGISNPLFAETYRALGRMKLAAVLKGEIIISLDRFETLKKQILDNFERGDVFELSEIRDSLPVGRRLLIPLLEEMDDRGYFEWKEEKRIVISKD